MSVSRRDVVKWGAVGVVGAGLVTVPVSTVSAKSASELDERDMPRPFRTAFVRPPKLRPRSVTFDPDGTRVNHYEIRMRPGTARILPRHTTPILGFEGVFPGPTIELERGTRSTVNMRNRLPRFHPRLGYLLATSTHLHGSASLPQYDGYANDLTPPGFRKEYFYPNGQAARTMWYHDHAVHVTAQNVYSGLAGMYVLHDPLERRLLPQGAFDVPLVVSDAMFAEDGSLAYDDRGHSGLWGDVILVNGRPWPVMKVQPRIYRFRILNASIARSYRFALNTGDPIHVVATEGGLMPRTQSVQQFRHGMAERYEVLIDFSKYRPGTRVQLRNLSNDNNRDYDHTNKVMAFDVTAPPSMARMKADPKWNRIPAALAGSEAMARDPAEAVKRRHFRVRRGGGEWTIDDVTWEDIIASNFKKVSANPVLGATEIWEFENKSGGWFHPMHVHLVDFKVLSRNGRAPFAYEQGPKDVVYVGENETVRLLMTFGPHQGRYMIHCHNLPHEDHSMMTQFRVGPARADPALDPVLGAPAVLDTGPD